jgi:beta-lactam-binding protein with PASTA domain
MQRLTVMLVLPIALASCAGSGPGSSADEVLVELPDVKGTSLSDGAGALQELGLCVEVRQGGGDELQHIVVEQDPAPGERVTTGTLVTIEIDTPDDVSATMEAIGDANEALSCTEGSGIGGVKGTGY